MKSLFLLIGWMGLDGFSVTFKKIIAYNITYNNGSKTVTSISRNDSDIINFSVSPEKEVVSKIGKMLNMNPRIFPEFSSSILSRTL